MKVLIVSEGKHELSGALEHLVCKLLPAPLDCVCQYVRSNRIHAVHSGKGYYKKAIRWMLEAQKDGYDALVLVIDEDHNPARLREINSAQEYQPTMIRRALGVAIRTFDAWMLADEQALSCILGYNVGRQKDPESHKDPKNVCAALLGDCPHEMTQAQMYASYALSANVEVMAERCPKGFAPFAERVRAL